MWSSAAHFDTPAFSVLQRMIEHGIHDLHTRHMAWTVGKHINNSVAQSLVWSSYHAGYYLYSTSLNSHTLLSLLGTHSEAPRLTHANRYTCIRTMHNIMTDHALVHI